jgi:D-glucosaminate PTS system EIIC component
MSHLSISIAMGLIFWFTRLRFGYTFSSILFQPVSIGLFVGILYGDIATGMKIGAAVQLVYLGVTSTPGGNVPSDPALASCVAIPIALQTGMEPTLAVALAVPFGVLGVFLDQLRRTTNSAWVHLAAKAPIMNKPNTAAPSIKSFTFPFCNNCKMEFLPIVYPLTHKKYPINIEIPVYNKIGIIAPKELPCIANGKNKAIIIGIIAAQTIESPIPATGPINPVFILVIILS